MMTCLLLSQVSHAAENLAVVLRCVPHSNLSLTGENLKLLVTELSKILTGPHTMMVRILYVQSSEIQLKSRQMSCYCDIWHIVKSFPFRMTVRVGPTSQTCLANFRQMASVLRTLVMRTSSASGSWSDCGPSYLQCQRSTYPASALETSAVKPTKPCTNNTKTTTNTFFSS